MFRQWANQARVTDDAVGDFIGDYRRDRGAPSDFESLRPRLRLYLAIRNACPEAIKAAGWAWKRYQSWQKQCRGGAVRSPLVSDHATITASATMTATIAMKIADPLLPIVHMAYEPMSL